jgi:hypothetical protein
MGGNDPIFRLQTLVQAELEARATGQELYRFLCALAEQDRFSHAIRQYSRGLADKLGKNHYSPSSLTPNELKAIALFFDQPPELLSGLMPASNPG